MNATLADLHARIASAFAVEISRIPVVTLRGTAEIDAGREPPTFDELLDAPSASYLERHAYDLPFLDASSWRAYLPRFLFLAVTHAQSSSNAVDGALVSLRPPDTYPARLASLSKEQEAVVVAILEFLAFGEGSVHTEAACTAPEEWWGEAPNYRPQSHVA